MNQPSDNTKMSSWDRLKNQHLRRGILALASVSVFTVAAAPDSGIASAASKKCIVWTENSTVNVRDRPSTYYGVIKTHLYPNNPQSAAPKPALSSGKGSDYTKADGTKSRYWVYDISGIKKRFAAYYHVRGPRCS